MEDPTLVKEPHYMKSAACLAQDLKFLLDNATILPYLGAQIIIPIIGVDCLLLALRTIVQVWPVLVQPQTTQSAPMETYS